MTDTPDDLAPIAHVVPVAAPTTIDIHYDEHHSERYWLEATAVRADETVSFVAVPLRATADQFGSEPGVFTVGHDDVLDITIDLRNWSE